MKGPWMMCFSGCLAVVTGWGCETGTAADGPVLWDAGTGDGTGLEGDTDASQDGSPPDASVDSSSPEDAPGVNDVVYQDSSEDAATADAGGETEGGTSKVKWHPGFYVRVTHPWDSMTIGEPNIRGAQVLYHWRDLESDDGEYRLDTASGGNPAGNPSKNVADLAAQGKYMMILFFEQTYGSSASPCVPAYMRDKSAHPELEGGQFVRIRNQDTGESTYPDEPPPSLPSNMKVVSCAPKLWIPAVQDRLFALFEALGARLDGEPYFEGFISGESSVSNPGPGAAWDAFFLEQQRVLSKAFPRSVVYQALNYTMNGKGVIPLLFQQAYDLGNVGIFGPDTVPGKDTWSTPYYRTYGNDAPAPNRIPLSMAMQLPYAGGTTAGLDPSHPWQTLLDYATGELHVNHFFWDTYSWAESGYSTSDPSHSYVYSRDAVPMVNALNGEIPNSACPENIATLAGGCQTNP